MSVIVSFPLMVYPLRASLHSLIFQQVSKNLSKKVNVKFQILVYPEWGMQWPKS